MSKDQKNKNFLLGIGKFCLKSIAIRLWKNIIQKASLIGKIGMQVYILRKISDARKQ